MEWRELLAQGVEAQYGTVERLFGRIEDSQLGWKPESGSNWMTVGQLLEHLATCCGMTFHGFITGEWPMPEGFDPADMKPEDMLPPAEKLPAVSSVAEAREKLAADKQQTLDALAGASDEALATQPSPAMWDPTPLVLGHRLLTMIDHMATHKAQLFYYLKLQGQPVNTGDLWGMG